MAFRCNFRDKMEWLNSTNNCIRLNTDSDEAAKYYDASVTQLVGWYEDQTLGGLKGSIKRMLEADPEFLLGRALALEVNLMGGMSVPRLNKELADRLDDFNRLIERRQSQASEHELLHAQVVNHWARNDHKGASRILEKLTTLYPEDLAALKMCQDTYFFMGQALAMRNSIANCLPKLNKDKNPLAGFAHGMFAFALEESNMYPQAQEQALKALEVNPRDTWAIHNYAHCLEMLGRTDEGLKWMLDKQADWEPCTSLASHQFWHTALFHINNNHFDEAVELLDKEILPRFSSSGTTIDMHDCCSMIYRMELVDLFGKTRKHQGTTETRANRWAKVYELCAPHKQDHLIGFNDAHYMMSYLGKGDLAMAGEFIESIDEAAQLKEGSDVVKPLLQAMLDYNRGAYAKCVDQLEPIRFDIVRIGGSHAQRDVFEQLLLVAALKSDNKYHNQLAQRMLTERETFHGRKTVQAQLLAGVTGASA